MPPEYEEASYAKKLDDIVSSSVTRIEADMSRVVNTLKELRSQAASLVN